MKKLIFLISFGFLITACSKEDPNDQIIEQTPDTINVLKVSNGVSTWETLPANIDYQVETTTPRIGGNSAHTHGEIANFATFSGTQNNGGAHGSAVIYIPGQLHIILETSSVAIIGTDSNEAIYGGMVAEVVFNNIPPPPPPPPCPTFPNCPPPPPPPPCSNFDIGTYVYFSVTDNGQGTNSDPDEYRGVLLPSCSASSNGFKTFPWGILGSVTLDPNGPDNVKVNN